MKKAMVFLVMLGWIVCGQAQSQPQFNREKIDTNYNLNYTDPNFDVYDIMVNKVILLDRSQIKVPKGLNLPSGNINELIKYGRTIQAVAQSVQINQLWPAPQRATKYQKNYYRLNSDCVVENNGPPTYFVEPYHKDSGIIITALLSLLIVLFIWGSTQLSFIKLGWKYLYMLAIIALSAILFTLASPWLSFIGVAIIYVVGCFTLFKIIKKSVLVIALTIMGLFIFSVCMLMIMPSQVSLLKLSPAAIWQFIVLYCLTCSLGLLLNYLTAKYRNKKAKKKLGNPILEHT